MNSNENDQTNLPPKWTYKRVQEFAENNKTVINTFSSILLGIAAIIVAVLQLCTSNRQSLIMDRQSDILNKQTSLNESQDKINKETFKHSIINDSLERDLLYKEAQISEKQYNIIYKEKSYRYLYDKNHLMISIWRFYDLSTKEGPQPFLNSRESKLKWFTEVRSILESELNNSVINSNLYWQSNWEKALKCTKSAEYWIIEANIDEETIDNVVYGCVNDITVVVDSIYQQLFGKDVYKFIIP